MWILKQMTTLKSVYKWIHKEIQKKKKKILTEYNKMSLLGQFTRSRECETLLLLKDIKIIIFKILFIIYPKVQSLYNIE